MACTLNDDRVAQQVSLYITLHAVEKVDNSVGDTTRIWVFSKRMTLKVFAGL